MAASRKGFLVLAVLLALAGANTANAQGLFHPSTNMTCQASAVPAVARAEGIAELLGDIIIQCQIAGLLGIGQVGFFPMTFVANVGVTLNVAVTNNIDFGGGSGGVPSSETTDAIMVVNGRNTSPVTFAPAPNANPTAAFPAEVQVWPHIQRPQYGRRVGPGRQEWNNATFPTPGAVDLAGNINQIPLEVRITNMRGNVSQLGIPTGEGNFPTAQVTAFVQMQSQTAIPINNNVLNVGIPLVGLLQSFRQHRDFSGTLPIVRLQCVTAHLDSDNNITEIESHHINHAFDAAYAGDSDNRYDFGVRLSEGFASAFKTLGVPTSFPAQAAVEDGYPTPPSGVNGGGATQGTRFLIRFFNVPSGVRLALPNSVRNASASVNGHFLRLVRVPLSDANGGGALGLLTGTFSTEVAITGTFGLALYEVVDDDPFAVENVFVPVVAAHRANTGSDLPAVGTMQMSVTFAPISTVTSASASAPEPRFVDTSSNRNVLQIVRCSTVLLYPFVTNQAGFDTGFSIANTTRDPFGTTAQAGTCTLNYYGGTTGGGAAPPAQTSAIVASGQTIVWTLSGGNAAVNITGTPGFQGYIIAICQFQFAHGFAFITDGFGGVPAIAEGYLALIIPNPGSFGGRLAAAAGFIGFVGTGENLGH